MKRAAAFMAFLFVLAMFAGLSTAAEEVYMAGKVKSYEAGKSITITDEEGNDHTFTITEDTDVSGKINKGVIVEVWSVAGVADSIEVMENE